MSPRPPQADSPAIIPPLFGATFVWYHWFTMALSIVFFFASVKGRFHASIKIHKVYAFIFCLQLFADCLGNPNI
jgi:hypothetical protein